MVELIRKNDAYIIVVENPTKEELDLINRVKVLKEKSVQGSTAEVEKTVTEKTEEPKPKRRRIAITFERNV